MSAHFDTTQYELAHGKKPRGQGYWILQVRYPTEHATPSSGRLERMGTLTEVKRAAREYFPSVKEWIVLP